MKSLVYRTASVVLSENEFDSGDIEETFGPSSWFCVAAIQNCCCSYTAAAGSFSPAPSGRRLVLSSHTQLVICVPPSPAAGWLARWLAGPLLHCSCRFRETKAESNDPRLPAWCDCVFHEKAGLRFPFSSPAAAAVTRYAARIFAPRPALSARHGSGLSLTCCKTRRS